MGRYKNRGKGWYGESHRHYLASKGIKTGKYDKNRFNAFKTIEDEKPTDLIYIDDDTPAHKFRLFQLEMSPDEFLKKTKEAGEKMHGEKIDFNKFVELGRSEAKQERIKEGLKKEEKVVPAVVLRYDEDGELEDFQEGRNRAIAAKEMGMDKIPVIIAQRRSRGDRQLDFEGDLPRTRFGTPMFNLIEDDE